MRAALRRERRHDQGSRGSSTSTTTLTPSTRVLAVISGLVGAGLAQGATAALDVCEVVCSRDDDNVSGVLESAPQADAAVDNLSPADLTDKAVTCSHPGTTFAVSAASLEHPHSPGNHHLMARLFDA
jgi:hypothetical protein